MGLSLSKLWNNNNIDNLNKIIIIEITDGVLNTEKLNNNDLYVLYKCLKKSKVNELQSLDYAIDNLNNKLIANRNEIRNNFKKIENELIGKYECSICLERPKEKLFIPCGHSFCSECAAKYNNICSICRGSIERIQHIY